MPLKYTYSAIHWTKVCLEPFLSLYIAYVISDGFSETEDLHRFVWNQASFLYFAAHL